MKRYLILSFLMMPVLHLFADQVVTKKIIVSQDGNNFTWFSNFPANTRKSSITIEWVFGNRWIPQKTAE